MVFHKTVVGKFLEKNRLTLLSCHSFLWKSIELLIKSKWKIHVEKCDLLKKLIRLKRLLESNFPSVPKTGNLFWPGVRSNKHFTSLVVGNFTPLKRSILELMHAWFWLYWLKIIKLNSKTKPENTRTLTLFATLKLFEWFLWIRLWQDFCFCGNVGSNQNVSCERVFRN